MSTIIQQPCTVVNFKMYITNGWNAVATIFIFGLTAHAHRHTHTHSQIDRQRYMETGTVLIFVTRWQSGKLLDTVRSNDVRKEKRAVSRSFGNLNEGKARAKMVKSFNNWHCVCGNGDGRSVARCVNVYVMKLLYERKYMCCALYLVSYGIYNRETYSKAICIECYMLSLWNVTQHSDEKVCFE